MAKLECKLQGDFDQILHELDDVIMKSISATLEEYSDFEIGNCRCAIRVYERYSFVGGNPGQFEYYTVARGGGVAPFRNYVWWKCSSFL